MMADCKVHLLCTIICIYQMPQIVYLHTSKGLWTWFSREQISKAYENCMQPTGLRRSKELLFFPFPLAKLAFMKIEILEKPLKCKIALLWFKYTLARKVPSILLRILALHSILPSIQIHAYYVLPLKHFSQGIVASVSGNPQDFVCLAFANFVLPSSKRFLTKKEVGATNILQKKRGP